MEPDRKHNRITNTDEILADIYQELVSVRQELQGRNKGSSPDNGKVELRGIPKRKKTR